MPRVRAGPELAIRGERVRGVSWTRSSAAAGLRVSRSALVIQLPAYGTTIGRHPRRHPPVGEPGALERVAELAIDWFTRHLAVQPAGTERPM